jgi:rubrerythrin
VEVDSALQSYRDLRVAFVEEAALAFRYLYFAQIAEIEGLGAVAKQLREIAEGAVCAAHGSLDFLREGDPVDLHRIGDTEQNLRAAISMETEETSVLFPAMARRARENGFGDVASWMDTLAKLKQSHLELLLKLQQSHCPAGRDPIPGT